MEERSVEAVDDGDAAVGALDAGVALAVGFAGAEGAAEVAFVAVAARGRRGLGALLVVRIHMGGRDAVPAGGLDVLAVLVRRRSKAAPFVVLRNFRRVRRAVLPANLGHAEDRFPPVVGFSFVALLRRRRVPETGGHEGPLRPAVVDACHVPIDRVRSRVAVQLIAYVDQMLGGGDVDVIHG